MITNKSVHYGCASNDHFWIVCPSRGECNTELKQYAEEHPEQNVLFVDCGTKPDKPIPVPVNTFEVYTPKTIPMFCIGWNIYQYGRQLNENLA